MNLRRAAGLCALLALPVGLSGCVAAAAIPVLAAGGILANEERKKPAPEQAPAEALAQVPAPLPPEVEVEVKQSVTSAATVLNPAVTVSFDVPPLSAAGEASLALFIQHAEQQALRDPVEAPRQSAILATVGSLTPETSDCGILPPAVLIDLDPAGAQLDTDAPLPTSPTLTDGLARLRQRDVAVHWIAASPAVKAGQLREQLLAAQLDPWGRDTLLLLRRAGDTKEARRRELAKTHCVVAIAGDSRSDFDELFDYLRDPAMAAPLDVLLGKGWFLTPPASPAAKD